MYSQSQEQVRQDVETVTSHRIGLGFKSHLLPAQCIPQILCNAIGRETTDVQAGLENHSVEHLWVWVAAGGARSRSAEQRRGSYVKRKSSVWKMEAPSPSGEPAVPEIRPGCCRFARPARKCAVPSVILLSRGGCTVTTGCSGSPVAKHPAVHVPPSLIFSPCLC